MGKSHEHLKKKFLNTFFLNFYFKNGLSELSFCEIIQFSEVAHLLTPKCLSLTFVSIETGRAKTRRGYIHYSYLLKLGKNHRISCTLEKKLFSCLCVKLVAKLIKRFCSLCTKPLGNLQGEIITKHGVRGKASSKFIKN